MGIGTQLREARQRAHVTTAELASRTKIPASLLDAIDRDDFARVPSGAVRRGFLRAYAREVGLDPETIVREYRAQCEPDQADAAVLPPLPGSADRAPSGASRLGPWLVAGAAGALLLILSRVAVYPPPPTDADVIPAAGIPWTEPYQGREVAPAGLTGAFADNRDARWLTVDIDPMGDVWMEALADGEPVVYQVVSVGDRWSLSARDEIALKVGDAAGIRYWINGEPGRPLGGPGEVVDLLITRDNYRAFQLASPSLDSP